MLLELENLMIGYHYPLLEIPVNLHFQPSEINLLIGNNGCGKTTLIKTIAKLHKPLNGNVKYNHQDIHKISDTDYPKYFSFLFTTKPFLMNHTVFDIIALGRIPYLEWNGKLSTTDIEIIHYYAELLNIQELLNKPADKISDGQLQKTLIGKTLSQQSPVIILDEPLAFLDYSSKKTILQTLRNIAINENKIILLSTHDIHLSINFADKILFIHQKQWLYETTDKIHSSILFNDFIDIKN